MPDALSELVDVVVVAVVDDSQLTEVLSGPKGAFGSARPGTSFVVVSTVSPATVDRWRSSRSIRLRARGLRGFGRSRRGGRGSAGGDGRRLRRGGRPGEAGARRVQLARGAHGSRRERACRRSWHATSSSTARGSPPTRASDSRRRRASSFPSWRLRSARATP